MTIHLNTDFVQTEVIDIYGRRLTALKHEGKFLVEMLPHVDKTLSVFKDDKLIWRDKLETTTSLPPLPRGLYTLVVS